jgi:hypothetical protein
MQPLYRETGGWKKPLTADPENGLSYKAGAVDC